MTKINTKRLKANLSYSDYQKILKALGIPFHSQGKNYDTLYTACHNKNPYDGSPKLLFYKDKGIFQCTDVETDERELEHGGYGTSSFALSRTRHTNQQDTFRFR